MFNIGRAITGAITGGFGGGNNSFSPGQINTIQSGATIFDNTNGRRAMAANALDQEATGAAQMDHDRRVGTVQRAVATVQNGEQKATQDLLTSQNMIKQADAARGRKASEPYA